MEKFDRKKNNYIQEIEDLKQSNRRILEQKDVAEERFRQQTTMYEMTMEFVGKQNNELEKSINKLQTSEKNLSDNLASLQTILNYVEKQKEEVEKKNTAIMQSIEYAKRIQTAILPTQKSINALLDNSFVFYQPKDIVSGDFYWVNQISGKTIIIVGDCTGHGVPGAIMATITNNLINEVVLQKNTIIANEIIFSLHQAFISFFIKSPTVNVDGADISVCVIDKNTQTLTFAGAMHTLMYVQDNEFRTFKGTSLYLGRKVIEIENASDIETHTIDISIPTMVYLSSDGYYDQFGGDIDYPRKFMNKRFRELLFNVADKEMEDQKRILRDTMAHWKLGAEQTDDMVVFGMRF